MECKFCKKAHDPSGEHDYVGKCRMQGCARCETGYKLHCRARDSAKLVGVKLTRNDPDDHAGQCGECRVPAYRALVGHVKIWAWLQDVAAPGGAQWSIEDADKMKPRPQALCPRCRKAKAA